MLTRLLTTIFFCCLAGFAYAQPTLNPPGPKVLVSTSLGTFTMELFPTASPITVDNFLRYVRTDYYNGMIFHRVIPGRLIQGGGYTHKFRRRGAFEPIRNESNNGLSNLRGTVSMSRTEDPDSATTEFLINLADNKELDHAGGELGFTVFGRVIDGMEVVDDISRQPAGKHRGPFRDAPSKNVLIHEIRVLDDPNKNEAPASISLPAS